MIIDSHCHLDLLPSECNLDNILERAGGAGVLKYVVPGVSPAGWEHIAALAAVNTSIFPAFGIHPLSADLARDENLAQLATYLTRSIAVGEIGLDYTCVAPTREIQKHVFRSQLKLAVQMGLPVIIHCRNAFADLLSILRAERVSRVGGVMHAFSGSVETAQECMRLGFLISVCGTVTYTNVVRPVRIVKELPLESLVLETDAPDISPEPFRGVTNEPAYLIEIAKKVAEIKGVMMAEVAAITTRNAEQVFRLSKFDGAKK